MSPATSSIRISNPRILSYMASHDLASIICQVHDVASNICYVIDTHF